MLIAIPPLEKYVPLKMPRRASSSVHPAWMIGVTVILAVLVIGGYFAYAALSDPFRTLAPLNVESYLENANSLRGNSYKLDATVLNSLAWSSDKGRLFSVEVDSNNSENVLPLVIPASFNHINIQKGQRFLFRIQVEDKGVLRAEDLHKA